MKLSNKVYDFINGIKNVLPLLCTLICAVCKALGIEYEDTINTIMLAVIAFINSFLDISSVEYYKDKDTEDEGETTEERVVFSSLPDNTSKYFIRNGKNDDHINYGGYASGIAGKKEVYKGSTLNNCVGCAWGCFAMAEDNPDCKVGFIAGVQYPQGADKWWNNGKCGGLDTYERGTEVRLGSVICYTGHVAYVNEIVNDDEIVVITSDYNSNNKYGMYFHTLKKSENYKWTGAGDFQGFIYPKL